MASATATVPTTSTAASVKLEPIPTMAYSHIGTKPLRAAPTATGVNFGIEVTGVDLATITPEQFAELRDAVYRHHVVVVKGQGHVRPEAQLALTRMFDPSVETYGHGSNIEAMKKSVLSNDLISIPDFPQVKLIGNGPVEDHEGIAQVTLKHPMHFAFHKDTLPADDFEHTRFYRWHIDAALYDFNPPRVTTLLALETPKAARQTIVYDDGTGDALDAQLATTAFVSGATAFKLLSPEMQEWALKTKAKYAPHPYVWIRNAKALSTGLGIVNEGKELSKAELPEWSEEKVKVLPLVWKNAVTGEPSLQLHGCCVEDLITDGKPIGDLAEVRRIVNSMMRPAISPQHVFCHEWEAGDMVIFHNHGVWHSVVGTLRPEDRRVYHQCNLAASEPPKGMDE